MTNLIAESIDFFEKFLSDNGYTLEEFQIESKYVKVIFVKRVYGLNSVKLVEELSKKETAIIGIQNKIHNATISSKEKELEQDDLIEEIAERCVYWLLCTDVDIPQSTLDEWNVDPQKTIYYPRNDKKAGLLEWVDELIAVLSPLIKYYEDVDDLIKNIGYCAHLALQDLAPSGGIDTADWLYSRENIPRGNAFMTNIKDSMNHNQQRDFSSIVTEGVKPRVRHDKYPEALCRSFDSCFNNFVNLAKNVGFFEGQHQLAVDTTSCMTVAENPDNLMISVPPEHKKPVSDDSKQWMYQIISSIKYPSKFVLSVEPIYRKDRIPDALDYQLEHLSQLDINIDLIVGDSQYYNKKSLLKFDNYNTDWMVRGERRGDIMDLIHDVHESGLPESDDEVDVSTPAYTPKPSGFAYPLKELSQPSDDDRGDDDNQNELDTGVNTNEADNDEDKNEELFIDIDPKWEVIAYITRCNLSNNVIRKGHVTYRLRKRIESKFGQIKNKFIAYTETTHPAVRYYMMAIGCVFYNFHYLINRTLSPQNGYPLTVSGKEWLTAIRHEAFADGA